MTELSASKAQYNNCFVLGGKSKNEDGKPVKVPMFIDKHGYVEKLWGGKAGPLAYTGLNLPHAREKPATSPENFCHLAGEGCQCKRETTYCEEHTKDV